MKKYAVVIVLLALLVAGGYYAYSKTNFGASSGPDHYNPEYFNNTLTIGSSGTAISQYRCSSFTLNPTVISSSTVATSTVALLGSSLGDMAFATFAAVSSTNEWVAEGKIGPAGSSTIIIKALPGTAAWSTGLDLGTSTAKVCSIN